jgi:hypothetical protein
MRETWDRTSAIERVAEAFDVRARLPMRTAWQAADCVCLIGLSAGPNEMRHLTELHRAAAHFMAIPTNFTTEWVSRTFH